MFLTFPELHTLKDTKTLFRARLSYGELLFLIVGTILRLVYAMTVPWILRSYDSLGHIRHNQFVLTYWSIPRASTGWENFQPPLYYTISALLAFIPKYYGVSNDDIIVLWKYEACFFSIVLLFVTVFVGRQLFNARQEAQRLWLLATVTFFPTIVFCATRVSNDPLYYIFAFLWCGTIVAYWKRPRRRTFVWMSVLCGLGLLTKTSMLPMTALSFVFLFLCRRITSKEKAICSAMGMVIVVALAGWFHVSRALHTSPAEPSFIIGNLKGAALGLFFNSQPKNFFVFDPIKIVQYPRCSAWKTDTHRVYFWEYYFKSAYTGEFLKEQEDFEYVFARLLLTGTILLLPYLFFGFIRTARTRSNSGFPLVFVMPVCLATQVGFTYTSSLANTQDFRVFSFLLIIYSYFIIEGIYASAGLVRGFGKAVFASILIVSLAFLIYLSWVGPHIPNA